MVTKVQGDPAGVTPQFILHRDSTLLLADAPSDLLPHMATPKADLRGLAQMVAASGPIGGRTLFEEVSRIQPGEAVWSDRGIVHRSQQWDWESFIPTTRSTSQLLEAVSAEVHAHTSAQDVVSMLSGGWDSRLLLALAHQRGSSRVVRALTTSSDTGTVMEELVAAQVAQILDLPHEIVMPHRDMFGDDLAMFANAVDFQTSFHLWLVPLVRRLAEVYPDPQQAVVLDGLGGGLFVGGAFADPLGAGSLIDKRLAGGTRYLAGAEAVLNKQVIAHFREAITEDAEPIIRRHISHPHGNILSAYLTRTWPGISLAPHGLVAQVARVATPFVSSSVVHEGLSIYPEEHRGDRLYPILMEKLHPRLAALHTAQERVPWPRPHPRRIASIEAIRHLRSLILTEPINLLLAPALIDGGPAYWRKVLGTTGGQHLVRGLAVLSLWWQRYRDDVKGFDVEEWLR